MPMMTSQILKFVNFSKTQKSKLRTKHYFFQIKKLSRHTLKGDNAAKNLFLAEVIFNENRLRKDLNEVEVEY